MGRAAVVAGLVVVFLVLTWNTGREGFSSLLSAYAARTYEIDAANAAVGLSSGSPDAHFVRAAILEARNDPVGAGAEYSAAALARPDAADRLAALVLEMAGARPWVAA